MAIAAAALLAPAAAGATNYPVSTTADAGAGSLRQAITDAETLTPFEADIITFTGAGTTGTITLASVLPLIEDDLDIQGPGADQLSVSGGGVLPHVFENIAPQTTISGLTIRGGNAVGTQQAGASGVSNYSGGTLTLTEVTVRNNISTANQPTAATAVSTLGGGIYNDGVLNLVRSTVRANTTSATATTAKIDTAEATASGGGIYTDLGSTLNLESSTVSGNTAVANATGFVGTRNAAAYGAGIRSNTASGMLTIRRSTVSGNHTEASGADSEIVAGSGIDHTGSGLNVASSTITGNEVVGDTASGANVSQVAGAVYENTIISAPVGAANCNVVVASSGHNIESPGTSCGFTEPTDRNGVIVTGLDPALADNGGPTMTHALLPGSIAIDSGLAGLGETLDQRGQLRPFDFIGVPDLFSSLGADVGAFERQAEPPAAGAAAAGATPPGGQPFDLAAALKKCKKKKSRKARKKCKKRALKLRV